MKENIFSKKSKGFTLVEVIVVLVILAILAAILIPSLIGYVDKANERKLVAETRAAVMAAQTIATESYANGISTGVTKRKVAALAELKVEAIKSVELDYNSATNPAKVIKLVYSEGKYTCTYANGKYTTSKA